jgi:tRNA pseudouridine38-40 synthase
MVDCTHILTLAYRGTLYHGWQRQENQSQTIQGILEGALERIFKKKIITEASGRTDAGVHALGQIVAFKATAKHSPLVLVQALNANLPRDIRVLRATRRHGDFHPRFDAVSKTYLYKLYCHPILNPFIIDLAWHQPVVLDLKKMRKASRMLLGRHDFSSFFTNPGYEVPDRVRRILRLTVCQVFPEMIEIRITADGFLHRMVRNIVGALVAVGRNKISTDDLQAILQARSREHAPATAPAHGLYLERVSYRKRKLHDS